MDPIRLVPLIVNTQNELQNPRGHEIFWIELASTDTPRPISPVTDTTIDKGIERVAGNIRGWLEQRNEYHRKCMIGILKGGLVFQYRLLDHLRDIPFLVGHIGRSSYKQKTTGGGLQTTYDLDLSPDLICNADVFLVDDVLDTGRTIRSTLSSIKELHPASIHIAVLVDKVWKRREIGIPDPRIFSAFYTEDGYDPFIVGCGMGLGEAFRTLPGLYEVQKV